MSVHLKITVLDLSGIDWVLGLSGIFRFGNLAFLFLFFSFLSFLSELFVQLEELVKLGLLAQERPIFQSAVL